MSTVVELRCDRDPRRLFAKVQKPRIVDGNLIEFACRDCRRELGVKQVLHRFNVLGELIESEVIRQ